MRATFIAPVLSLCTALLVGAVLPGCSENPAPPEPKVLGRLGSSCSVDDDCGSSLCLRGLCSRFCGGQGDCPEGFDCGTQAAEDPGATCYAVSYAKPATGGYGTSCSLFVKDCNQGPNPCAEGFHCDGQESCDPGAICTTECLGDSDCPPSMFCGVPDRTAKDVRKCMKRVFCSPCGNDDQCPRNHRCVPDADGGRYCAKTCAVAGDCRKPEKDGSSGEFLFLPFETCEELPDGSGSVCQPTGNRCHGISTVPTIEGENQVCSQCRVGFPEDCAEGHGCIELSTGERMCSRNCILSVPKGRLDNYAHATSDCPEGTYCFPIEDRASGCPAVRSCEVKGICNRDSTYRSVSCQLPLQ